MSKIHEYQKTRNELAKRLAEEHLTDRQRANFRASFEQLSDEISYLSRQE
jgi:hypothetical protein